MKKEQASARYLVEKSYSDQGAYFALAHFFFFFA
jgi:hypothetical protein